MRAICGSAQSRKLVVPKGAEIRPTGDMVREALFSSLGYRTIDARFGDLYAGSGSVGIEAISRGAAKCVFVEKNPRCLEALRTNLENTRLADRAEVVRGDCLKMIEPVWRREPLDIVFMDAPYRESSEELLQLVLRLARETAGGPGLASECLIVVQCERGMEPSVTPDREKRYGSTVLLYYEVAGSA